MLRGVYFELEFSRRSITELARTCLITNYPPGNPLLPPTGRVYPRSDDGTQWVSVNTAFSTEPGSSFIRHGSPITWIYEWEDLYQHAENIPARRCEFVQKLRLAMARREFSADGSFTDIDTGVVEGTALAELTTVVMDNVPYFMLNVTSFTVETPGLSAALVKTLQNYVPTSFGTTMIPLPISRFLGQSGSVANPPPGYNPNLSSPHIQNCGTAYSADLSVFALRVQLGGAPSSFLQHEWATFHAGNFPNRLLQPDGSSAQWATLLSPRLVEQLARAGIEEQLAEHTDEFQLIGGVTAQWAPEAGEARVIGNFYGELIIPCRPRYEVSYFSRLMVSMTTPNNLISSGFVTWDGNDLDLLACEVLTGLSLGLVGAAIGAKFGGPLGAAVGAGVGFTTGFIGGVLFATFYVPDLSAANCVYDGAAFTCTRQLNPGIQVGGQTLPVLVNSAVPSEDGLVLVGTYQLPTIPALDHTLLQFEVAPFGFTDLPVSCGNLSFAFLVSTNSAEAAKFTHSEATVTVRAVDDDGQPRRIPWLTATRTSADPQGVFPPSSIQVVTYDDRTVVLIRPVLIPANSAEYFAAPYGIRLNLQTSAGVRTVEIGPVKQLTQEDLDSLRSDALRKLNDCLARQRDIGKRGGRFDLEWLIDPAPYERDTYRLWQVGVLRLTPGDRLVGEDLDGNRLGEAIADEHGIARLTVLTGAGPANRELVLRRLASRDLEREAELRVKQVVLVPQGSIPLPGRLRSVTTRDIQGRRLAAIHTTQSVTLFDLTFPTTPRAHLQMDSDGVDAIAVTDSGLTVTRGDVATTWLFDETGPQRIRQEREAVVCSPGVNNAELSPVRRMHRAESPAGKVLQLDPVEFYAVGSTVLVPAADRRSLDCFTVGRTVSA